MRRITWPSTQLSVCSPPGALRDVILLRGIEPNMRWRQFCAELLAASEELGAEHGRDPRRAARRHPAHPPDPGLRHRHRARASPTGSSSSSPTTRARPASSGSSRTPPPRPTCPSVSFWAAVPHYVAQPPCPKATLALLGQLEDLLEVSIPLADLPEEARAWERGVDELVRGGRGDRRLRPGARGDPGHRRPPRGERRGHRARVRAVPQAPRVRRRLTAARPCPPAGVPPTRMLVSDPGSPRSPIRCGDLGTDTPMSAGRVALAARAGRRGGRRGGCGPGRRRSRRRAPRRPRRRRRPARPGASRSSASAARTTGTSARPASRDAPATAVRQAASRLSRAGEVGVGPLPVGAVVVREQRQPDRHRVDAGLAEPGDQHQVALGLRHLLALVADHPGVHVGPGEGRARRRRPAPRTRSSRGAGTPGRCRRPGRRSSAPRWCSAIAEHSMCQPGRPRPSARVPGRLAGTLAPARAGSPAGPSCRAGRGRRRARRRPPASRSSDRFDTEPNRGSERTEKYRSPSTS